MTNYDSDTASAFGAIAANFDAVARCEMPDGAAGRCQGAAVWLVDFHGCSRGLMCTPHLRASQVSVASAFARTDLGAPCNWCGRHFASFLAACKVVAL